MRNTWATRRVQRGSSVHPHTSGEYVCLVLFHQLGRFIPTQVGNTRRIWSVIVWQSVHPHTSGEYIKECSVNTLAYGSSPHKWGIRYYIASASDKIRFIPTQVGNTARATRSTRSLSVHPHTSGEYACKAELIKPAIGSSPHKWGIPDDGDDEALFRRFIPTQVGNTAYYARKTCLSPVHPHTSGEYEFCTSHNLCRPGSSPHKWGILTAVTVLTVVSGSSPHKWGIPYHH